MKRVICILCALVICLAMTACGSNKEAFEASKAAYDTINTAYEITSQLGGDVYEAWRMGIYEADEVKDGGIAYLASNLSLTEEELGYGVGYLYYSLKGEEWNDSRMVFEADYYFWELKTILKDEFFSLCVLSVTGAYTVNGKIEEARSRWNPPKRK